MQGFGWLAKLSWWFDVPPCPPWLTQIEWNKLPVVFEHSTPDWSSKDICDTCTNCSTSDRTEPLPFFQLRIRFFCDPHMTHMTRTNDINQKSLDIWHFVWMQVFEVEKLASNQTGDVPVCQMWQWKTWASMMDKCLSTDKCVSAYARSVEQVQQEGQLYPNQQASSRDPMPPTTLVLQGGHAETWKLLSLQLFTVVSYQTRSKLFFIMSQNPKNQTITHVMYHQTVTHVMCPK